MQSVVAYFHFIADRAIASFFFFNTKMLEYNHVTHIGRQTQAWVLTIDGYQLFFH